MNNIPEIYRIKITLEDSSPSVWRRIEIPSDAYFEDLSLTLQDAMGWEDIHAYEFLFGDTRIKSAMELDGGDSLDDGDFLDDEETCLDEFFGSRDSCLYIYDMGDRWRHSLQLEKRLVPDENQAYPWCMDGSGACPPEDCGGISRYKEILAAAADPKNPRHKESLGILQKGSSPKKTKKFNPEYFDVEAANLPMQNYNEKPSYRIPPTTEQWQKLYDCAFRIRNHKPWHHLRDSDYIAVELPGHSEPVYFVTMGMIGECMAVASYVGNTALANLELMRERAEAGAFFSAAGMQDSAICFFGDREEVIKEDRLVMKELDIKFRGRGQWIYFRSMKAGYAPWLLSYKEAELLCRSLEQYTAALDDLASGFDLDFRDGEILTRRYTPPPSTEGWKSYVSELDEVALPIEHITVKDELYIARLNRQKKTDMCLEIDLMYLPAPVQETKDDRPYFPRLLMTVDSDTGLVLDQELMSPEDDKVNTTLVMLSSLINAHGKPRYIYVRDQEMGNILEDICCKLHINLECHMSMPVLDEAVVSLMGYLGFDEDLES